MSHTAVPPPPPLQKFFSFPPPPLPLCFFQKSALVVQRVKLTACTPLQVIWPALWRKKKKEGTHFGRKEPRRHSAYPCPYRWREGPRGGAATCHGSSGCQEMTIIGGAPRLSRPLSPLCKGSLLRFFHHRRPPLPPSVCGLVAVKEGIMGSKHPVASPNLFFIRDTKRRSIKGGDRGESCLGAPGPEFNKYKCFRTSRLGPSK